MTLLEQAKKIREREGDPQYKLSPKTIEEAELFIAWIMGEVDNRQVASVLKFSHHNSTPTKVGPVLREMAKFGRISITILPEGAA